MLKHLFSIISLLLLGSLMGFALPQESNNEQMQICIEIVRDRKTCKIYASLSDNSSAREFYTALKDRPISVQMHDYGNFEKVGNLGKSFSRNDTLITTEPGDLILYQGNQIVIYYDENTWSFTRLGKIMNITSEELRTILGDGNIKAVFSIYKNKT